MAPGSNNDQFNWNKSVIKQYLYSLYLNDDVRHDEGRYFIVGKFF